MREQSKTNPRSAKFENKAAPQATHAPEINLGDTERQISLVGGAMLSAMGFGRGGLRGIGLMALGGMLVYRGASGHCPLYAKMNLNNAPQSQPPQPSDYFEKGIHIERSVSVSCPKEELYAIWRDFSNLPRFMTHLKSVDILDEKRSRWTTDGPAGTSIQWEAEIINDESPSLIAWRSTGNADVATAGSVQFASETEGVTEVRVIVDYIPPAGKLGAAVAKAFGADPESQIAEDLQRFKELMESGDMSIPADEPHESPAGTTKDDQAVPAI